MAILVSKLNRETRRQLRKQIGVKQENKYQAERVKLDGIVFDSKRESEVYLQLLMRQKMREISGLKVHPRFDLIVDGQKVATYIADFQYNDRSGRVVVDVKSKPTRTRAYRMKVKLLKALHGITVKEIL